MIGRSVGNYRIVARLGEGGMGVVFLAAHPTLGRRAAVKLLRTDLALTTENVERFFGEARAADAIDHPGVVKVFDLGTTASGAPYIVMELLEGETVAARLRRCGPLPCPAAVDIAAQVADALRAAHAKGIVHRDLKPDNLFLVADPEAPLRDEVRVLDFGIATADESPRSGPGRLIGTPLYASPELCAGTGVDHRTDIYSLGIVLHELLVGAPPFTSEDAGELSRLHINVLPPPLRERNPALPEALERIVVRALAKNPDERFASMGELRASLDAWASPSVIPTSARGLRRAVGLGVLATAGMLGVLLASRQWPQRAWRRMSL